MRSFDEMDGRSSRLEREAAQRRDEAKKRAEKERLAKQKFDADAAVAKRELEAKRKRDAAIAEAREAAALEQSRLTGGVRWQKTYRSGAVARHGDRVSLPQSALEDLTALGVLDGAGTALTFELELVDPASGKVSGVREAEFVDAAGRRSRARAARATAMDVDGDDDAKASERLPISATATHCGVLDFVAEDGAIGLPPKTMLSLVRGDPELAAALEAGDLRVRCRYVRLPRPAESSCSLRPIAEGFHGDGKDEAAVDLEAVLTRELGRGRHACLTVGDWIAVKHDGATVRLVVADMSPEDALCVLRTDLSVEVLPPMALEDEKKRLKAVEARAEQQAEAREASVKAADDALRSRGAASAPAARVRLRFPDGHKAEATFGTAEPAALLGTLVDAHAGAGAGARLPLGSSWRLVSGYPRKVLGPGDLAGSVGSLGLVDAARGGGLALLVEVADGGDAPDADAVAASRDGSDVWARAAAFADAERARETKDDELLVDAAAEIEFSRKDLSGASKADLFKTLVGRGLERNRAANAAQRYSSQLLELDGMGLLDDPTRCVALLDRYGGRLLRVVNALSDEREASFDAAAYEPPAPAPRPPAPSSQEAFAAAFARHVAAGLPPNEAAAAALAEAADAAPTPVADKWAEQRAELKAMGFDDGAPRTLALLDKYQGRLDRVVNALAEA